MSDNYNINLAALSRFTSNQAGLIHALARGKNWSGGPPKAPSLNDGTGLIFVTKPDFNLSSANVGHHRRFSPLLTSDRLSMGALIRDGLDPRSVHQSGVPHSALNDPLNPFFSILDNTATSLDGWPDYVMETYSSKAGPRGSQHGMYTGSIKDAMQFPLTSTHRNLPGDVINHIITYWQLWGDYVHHWKVSPHRINVINDRLDYASRWYRFAFDNTGQRVNQFTMCGYCYPISGNQGAVMGYSTDSNRNQGYDEITIQWDSYGVFHNDPIIIDEFNRTVSNFNPLMLDVNRENFMTKLGGVTHGSISHAAPFTGYGYPRINPRTMEFEIWVPNNQYSLIINDTSLEEAKLAIQRKTDEDFNRAFARLTPEERAVLYGTQEIG